MRTCRQVEVARSCGLARVRGVMAMVESVGGIPGKERQAMSDVRVDRLDALKNLAFLMRVDIDQRESLTEYLQYMDLVLERMQEEVVPHS